MENLFQFLREHHLTRENLATGFQIFGFLSAGLYFFFKAFSGLFHVSLNLKTECIRYVLNADEDFLIINLNLTGGENAMIELHEINGRIIYDDNVVKTFKFNGIERLEINNCDNNLKLDENWKTTNKFKYRIATKETTDFAHGLVIPSGKFYIVEVVVIGSRLKQVLGIIKRKPTKSQWRGSKLSAPIKS
jgi:hypothetical protein